MKKIIKLGISLLLISLVFVSCETVEDVNLDRSEKPIVNITSTSVTVMGETTSEITLSTDKPSDKDLIFKLVQTSGDAVSGIDYQFAEDSALDYGVVGGRIVIPAYATTGKTEVTGISDYIDGSKSASFTLEAIESIKGIVGATKVVDLTITDFFDPTKLTIIFSWEPHATDFDIVTWSDTAANPHTEWGAGGATGSHPEIDNSIWLEDPVGTYYVNIMDWSEGIDFPYKFTLLLPNGSIQIIEGTFTGTDKSSYINDIWTAWGGGYSSYRVLMVENSGTGFTVTAL